MSGFFSLLGEPVTAEDRALVSEYLRGLGITETITLETVPDWAHAFGVASDTNWDHRWWDAEQSERERLRARAFAAHSETETLRRLSSPFGVDSDVKNAATLAAERAGCTDAALVRSATGAACEALYLGALARVAGEPAQHPFRLKERLFSRGRWPLGIVDGRYWVF